MTDPFEPDPGVTGYVTTVTLTIAHPADVDPHAVVDSITNALSTYGWQGVGVGVATVELRGPGGLVGL